MFMSWSEDQRHGDAGGLAQLIAQFDDQRDRFFLWSPVALGAGIAAYFALPIEPGLGIAAAPFAIAMIVLLALPRGTLASALAVAWVLAGLGGLAAKIRVETMRAPVLQKRLNNVAVTGMIEAVEPREKRGARLTIAVEKIGDLSEKDRPKRVRVRTLSTHPVPGPGARVSLTASLAPPAQPVLPGAFDFARLAWFEGVGGVGYTFKDVTVLPHDARGLSWRNTYAAFIARLRASINARIAGVLEDQTAAIAQALITGERGGITKATNTVFRESGLFHVLSISGLHMVIMAGAVFFSVRLLLAAIPGLALRFEIKKWAAVAGMIGALCYLAISGGAFATVRSAIMILIMFAAMLLDRPALALRNVALAAFLILAIWPESLFDAGFQMSFAAVVGLVAAYEEVRRRFEHRGEPHPVLRVLLFFGGIVFSTLIAGAAVAPFAAYHFHQSQQYAVIANLAAIPICNFLVMPAALAALLAMPFGFEALPLKAMGAGIDAMTWCARAVAGLPGAVGHIAAMPNLAFALMALGGLWLALWQARWRLLGIAAIISGAALTPMLERPDVLVARGGRLVAVRGPDGLLSAIPARQSNYELERWLEHDGDARKAAEAAKAAAFVCDGVGCTARIKGLQLAVSRHAAAIGDDCARAELVVLSVPKPKSDCGRGNVVIDYFDVWGEGTHAIYIAPVDGAASGKGADAGKGSDTRRVRIDTVAAHRGDRPWAPVLRKLDGPKPAIQERGRGPSPPPGPRLAEDARRERAPLPGYAARPEWLAPNSPRPEIEDDEDEGNPESPGDGSSADRDPAGRDSGPQ